MCKYAIRCCIKNEAGETNLKKQTNSHLIFVFVFDSLTTIKAKEERRLKMKQQKLPFKADQSAQSENPQQAEDSAEKTRKGWFWWQICCSDYWPHVQKKIPRIF